MAQLEISDLLHQQRRFFQSGQTKDISFRIKQLKLLKQLILDQKSEIFERLSADLSKPIFESYALEIGLSIKEIDYALKHIKAWTTPQKLSVPIEQIPGSAWVYPEPLGIVLIVGAWNYPFQLIISPLVGAIAAGNCTILKPSEFAPHTSQFLADLFQKHFDPAYIALVEGGIETSQQLFKEKFDHIFFTGSTTVGKIVMEAAAKNLTPVTLELGGKSPCIVDSDINLDLTARRITWGKFINAGQTCIAPDYLLVDKIIKKALLKKIEDCIQEFYGANPVKSPDYARIINQKHFERLLKFFKDGEIIIGGETDSEDRYIAPTVIDNVTWDAPVMQEEIFGPILPIIEYDTLTEAIELVNQRPKPLALYFFSRNKNHQERILRETSSGGVSINDTAMQFGVTALPFGGVGNSGIGKYHGNSSFETFSHQKSVLKKSFLLDLKWRYAPYEGKLNLIKWLIG